MKIVRWVCLLALCSCGASHNETNTADEAERLSPQRLYPLKQGSAWAYDIRSEDGNTLAITRVLGVRGNRVDVSSGGNPVVYELREQGVYRPGQNVWLLKAPIRVGASWPSTQGMVAEVTRIDARVRTSEGEFRGCAEVREVGAAEGGGATRSITTVYCPDIGPVSVESKINLGGGREVRVVGLLRGHQIGEEP